ncbi:UNVERIFIED_CONTAM: hypothetical protein RF653_18075 [Kocuria sp. CPCC 205316]|uniref:hypothetical protein n=1 Tax=Kocuria TaxID=57493 RepID=UPI0036D8BDD6
MDSVARPSEPDKPLADAPFPDAAEAARLAALHELGLLDTAPEERFDRIVALVRVIFKVPVASITLIDADRQWIKAAAGMEAGVAVPRNYWPPA